MVSDRGSLRTANVDDIDALVRLWELLFDEGDEAWKGHAREWFARYVDNADTAWFPVIDVDGRLVAAAIGTLELTVPTPHCLRGRAVRLSNVITLPEYRGRGYGTQVVQDVERWARSIGADRVDLSATPDGRRLYEQVGFTLTSAPRMKLML
ncbi:GNAT family N-acetyltransferase [Kribbella sp. NPDC051952]|uniref:GNAT family N-acetyltransferase n=1 Tax=Kribbella sp. NPDC051952 TaxID=3154851 RepID=UPI00341B9D4A